ncbi:winged helix-turn-helix domain-containing protein [Streptosporangium sp. NPDC000239]|uniref:winged helix-turn-helix domain-containing protein n=1 Tax=Streptosporangium sp. NPDC000239 TaxID=3154248 RepID=UPI00332EBE67
MAVLFHVRHTLRGVSCLLHRLGWSPQIPAQRAVERGEGGDHLVGRRGVAGDRGRRSTWAPGCAGKTSAGRT